MKPSLFAVVLLLATLSVSEIRGRPQASSEPESASTSESVEDFGFERLMKAFETASKTKLGLASVADANHDDKLSYDEFLLLNTSSSEEMGSAEVKRNFDAIDTDHDGFLTREELDAF